MSSKFQYRSNYLHISSMDRSIEREDEVFIKWRTVAHLPPKKGTSVWKWLDEWQDLRYEVLAFGLETEEWHPKLFMMAVREIRPIWHEMIRLKMVCDKEEFDMPDLIESFSVSYSAVEPKYSLSLGCEQEQPEATAKVPFKKRPCPCGLKHQVQKCWAMNEEIRPQYWQLRANKAKKISAILDAEPKYRKWINKKIKDANAERKKSAIEEENVIDLYPDEPHYIGTVASAWLNIPGSSTKVMRPESPPPSEIDLCPEEPQYAGFVASAWLI